MIQPAYIAILLLGLSLGAASMWALDGCDRPLVDDVDAAAIAEASGDRTVEVDAAREPTEADTAAVSGGGGTRPAVRIEYRDRFVEVEAPTCADGSAPEVADGVRQVLVPDDTPPLAALPPGPDGHPRPVHVTPDRVVLTYREAEGDRAGRTVQDVFVVPERRWGYIVSAALSAAPIYSGDSLAWSPSNVRLSPAIVGGLRYRRVRLGVAMPLAADVRRSTLTISYRLFGKP